MRNHRAKIIVIAAFCAGVPAAVFAQGSLTPSGPPGANMVTLSQVRPRAPIFITSLPFSITNSGSYQLMTNIVATGTVSGISIKANDVSLDLNGFALIGNGTGTGSGIIVPASQKRITIRNGTISRWPASGIDAANAAACIIENVNVRSCGNDGIAVGHSSTIRSCMAVSNSPTGSGSGFNLARGCTIMRCIAIANGASSGFGFNLTDECTAIANIAMGSYVGIHAGNGSIVRCCTVANNVLTGIETFDNCQIIGNVCFQNNGDFLSSSDIELLGNRSTFDGNVCSSGYYGFHQTGSLANNVIIRNNSKNHAYADYDSGGIASGNDLAPVGTADTSTSPWGNL